MILSSSLGVRLRLGLGVRLRLRLRPRPSPRGKVGLSENLRDGKSDGVDGVVAGVGGGAQHDFVGRPCCRRIDGVELPWSQRGQLYRPERARDVERRVGSSVHDLR